MQEYSNIVYLFEIGFKDIVEKLIQATDLPIYNVYQQSKQQHTHSVQSLILFLNYLSCLEDLIMGCVPEHVSSKFQ